MINADIHCVVGGCATRLGTWRGQDALVLAPDIVLDIARGAIRLACPRCGRWHVVRPPSGAATDPNEAGPRRPGTWPRNGSSGVVH